MPELPEVETIARQLSSHLTGQRLLRFRIIDEKLKRDGCADKSKTGICTSVTRVGKRLTIRVSETGSVPARPSKGDYYFEVHLRMTGRLLWHTSPTLPPASVSHEAGFVTKTLAVGHTLKPRAVFEFEQGHLLFVDTRRFGTITHGHVPPVEKGVEPLSEEFSLECFRTLLASSRQPIKPWLLRQDRIVGIGNIYACEALFRAGIHPAEPAGSLSAHKIALLHGAIRQVLHSAVENAGTTFSDFRHSDGGTGSNQNFLTVYGRDGLPCTKCARPVKRIVQTQRSTFFCSGCQRRRTKATN